MLKKYSIFGSVVLAATLLLVGCGEGDSTSSTSAPTGYYLDSAVSGVSYVCGNQSGITGTDGSFKFQAGQDCTFSLAGITLRTVAATNLANGIKILENNVSVAKMLQTLDSDGNASNGITITTAVIAAVKAAGITSTVFDDAHSEIILFEAVKNVTGYTGLAKNDAEVAAHLAEEQTPIIKALIAGKTFYVPDSFTTAANGSVKELISVTFNADVTSIASTILAETNSPLTVGATYNETIELNGTKIMFPNDTDPTHLYEEYAGQTADYILLSDNGDLIRLYFDKAKAEAYYATLSPTTTTAASTFDAAALLAGKIFYAAYVDAGTKYLEQVVVNAAGTQLTFTPISPTGSVYTENVTMSGNIITKSTGSTGTVTAVTSTYIDISTAIKERWFSSQTDAQTYLNTL